jgi:hypothetical protein
VFQEVQDEISSLQLFIMVNKVIGFFVCPAIVITLLIYKKKDDGITLE